MITPKQHEIYNLSLIAIEIITVKPWNDHLMILIDCI